MSTSESLPSKSNPPVQSALSSAAPIFTMEENDWSDTETHYVQHQERSPSLVQVKPEPPQIKEEHQERSPSLVQVKPEPPQIKEEPEELLQRPEEAAGSSLTSLAVKSEDDDGNRETEPLASTSTEHMKTQADVEHCGTSQPTGEDQLLSSHRSDSDAEDSDDWDQSVLDRLKRGKKSFGSTLCGQVSGSMGDVKKHMRTQTGEFVCSVCNASFNQEQDMINHMRFHKKQKTYSCSVCRASFNQEQDMINHMRFHKKQKTYSCSVCRENFNYTYQLIKHMDTHTGGKPCASSVRSKRFTQSLNLETNTRTHAGSSLTLPAVKSEDDDGNRETEPLASTSTEHMKTQADVEHCGTSQPTVEVELLSSHRSDSDITEDSADWTSHGSDSDAEDSDEWVQSVLDTLKSQKTQRVEGQGSSLSNKLPQNMTSLKQTPSMSSQTGRKSYSSTECGNVSGSKSDLKAHVGTHSGEKTFSCWVCNKGFDQSQNLKTHMRTHTRERPFACSVCNRSYNRSKTLKQHMRIHTEKQPFSCLVCRNTFEHIQQLKKHMRAHTGVMPLRPFACSVCDKSFNRSKTLKQHMRIHTGEKPFGCLECRKNFRYKQQLQKHMRTHTEVMVFSSSVQSEDDDGNRETEPLASTSTEHVKTQADVE